MEEFVKKSLFAIFIIFSIFNFNQNFAQDKKRDKGILSENKNEFWSLIIESIDSFNTKKTEKPKEFVIDLSNYNLPNAESKFTKFWHNDPVPQANTNSCWSFSTTSFYESEIFRQFGKKVKLSEMWTVYWEFVEKARGFVQTRGEYFFRDGSESNAVKRIWQKYGIVPGEVFTGLLPGQKYLNTSDMFDEMEKYLQFVKAHSLWNEEEVLTTVKSIMNHWIGTPPQTFTLDGKTITPQQYLKDYLKINLSDYIEILSLKQEPNYKYVEYKVEDNWWHNKDYYNVPLDDFMKTIKDGIRKGYTICIGGDVSEPGKNSELDIFVVPTFDIPSEYIDEDSRQFRFSNNTTTDDHGIHIVGYLEKDGNDWYLIKDSGSGARNGKLKGYYIFSEDYVKLKMLDFTVHKDIVKELLNKEVK